ncbi:hypothetical protein [Segniliparus rugosus]|uniref:TPR repeat domain-containing protein n=1 Tax=Segniliparus rugosus (strain ATCC BAA-974 / DSM 45345 / CCUG 50838 / CIP 108380 / JCM 13579 / CDC 945) TaxID=679197 RepID=E5XM93_SEGRC|nr:hypothetical protein [Segniliparus rugosus]EFV14538.1 hypothetical protein HMPREF9336_00613 [Segniliparus rugosus ATCC BAA-974]
MAMFTLSQFLQMQFDHTEWAADRLRESGEPYSLNAAFVQAQTRAPGGEPFTGQAGEAAQDKGETIAGALNRFHAETDNAANVLKTAHEALWPAAWNLRNSINAAVGPVVIKDGDRLARLPAGFYVTEDWKIQADLSRFSGSFTPDQNEALNAWLQGAQEGLDKNREALEQASDKAAADLRANTHFGQVATDRQIGSLVGETPAQAKADVRAYLAGTATPEQKARVKAALELSEDEGGPIQQMRDGKNGYVTAEQNSVLQAFAEQTHGMSVEQLQALANRPGEDGRVFAEGLNDIGNDHLKCAVPDPAHPDQKEASFGTDKLPASIKDAYGSASAYAEPPTDPRYTPNWGELQSISAIVAKVPDSQLSGSGLTKGALESAASLAKNCALERGFPAAPPQAADLLAAAGRDTMSVHDLATGQSGKQFVDSLEHAKWLDGGTALSVLTDSALKEADVGPNVSEAQAIRAGETEHAFFKELAANKDSIDSHGDFAKSMTSVAEKYMPAMFGEHPPHETTRGFDYLDRGEDHEAGYPNTREALSVLEQDTGNANKIGSALERAKAIMLEQYAAAVKDHPGAMNTDDIAHLTKTGAVDGMVDRLATDIANREHQEAFAIKSMWADNAKDSAMALAALVPGGPLAEFAAAGATGAAANYLKMELLGDAPSPGIPPGAVPAATLYSVATSTGMGFPPELKDVITGPDGHLLPWSAVEQKFSQTQKGHDLGWFRNHLEAWLARRIKPNDGDLDLHQAMDRYTQAYNSVTR